MKRRTRILLFVLLLSIPLYILANVAIRTATRDRHIRALQDEAAALVKEERFAEASNKLEELQVSLMGAGRYQEALDASLKIEEVSQEGIRPQVSLELREDRRGLSGDGRRGEVLRLDGEGGLRRDFSRLEYFQDARLNALRDDPRFKKLVEACSKTISVGSKARDFQVTLLDGSTFTLSAQIGKVVLIDFWDVRCGPCREEMPNLKGMWLAKISAVLERLIFRELVTDTLDHDSHDNTAAIFNSNRTQVAF